MRSRTQDHLLSAVLIEFAQTMVTDFSIQDILDGFVHRIPDVLPVTGAGVTLMTADMVPDYVAASDGTALAYERLQTELRQGPCRASVKGDRAVAVPDLHINSDYPLFAPAAIAAGLGAVFAFPLRCGDHRIGALDLYRDTPGCLDEHDMATAQVLADVVSSYLTNAHSKQETVAQVEWFRDRALHDSLTGLANRVLLHERLEHASRRSQRTQRMTAVMFADLNRFKHINDTYGHVVGDELLIAVADRLAKLLREGDTLARVSGDEFVILCEDVAYEDDVRLLLTRIDEAFARPFVLGQREVAVTASIGIAFSRPGEAVTTETVYNADAAMYRAKRLLG